MKKPKILIQSPFIESQNKFTQTILKKKPKKDFQLLYRQRDESLQENPIESIIFVRSKVCKPHETSKKNKVQQQFKRIMNDLSSHLTQNRKSKVNKPGSKICSSKSSCQLKETVSTKKSTQLGQFHMKIGKSAQKATERQHNKIFKIVNKNHEYSQKQNNPRVQICKSPKKFEKQLKSPKTKAALLSPKSHKFQKENTECKQDKMDKICNKKSPKQKTTRKTPFFNQFNHKINLKRTKSKQRVIALKECKFDDKKESILRQRQNQNQRKKSQLKRHINKIPLKIEEYILIEDNFELIKQKNLQKLQTKLLSTYRNNMKQLEFNKIKLRQNQDPKEQIYFQKVQQTPQNQKRNFIERQSPQQSQFQINSQPERKQNINICDDSQDQSQYETTFKEFKLNTVKKFVTNKVLKIQKWWRKILNSKINKAITNSSQLSVELINKVSKIQKISEPDKKLDKFIQLDFPSAQSISCNQIQSQKNFQMSLEQQCDNKVLKYDEDLVILQDQKQIIKQKRQKLLTLIVNLYKEGKISKCIYEKKMNSIKEEYQNQFKEIMSLCEILENNGVNQSENQQKNQEDRDSITTPEKRWIEKLEEESEQQQQIIEVIKTIQEKKRANRQSSDLQRERIRQRKDIKTGQTQRLKSQGQEQDQNQHLSNQDQKFINSQVQLQDEQLQHQEPEIKLKIYKIGDKITSEMQSYITSYKAKLQQSQCSQPNANQSTETQQNQPLPSSIQIKYNKRTNQLGQEYFQDFQSQSSNDNSPHKSLGFNNVQEAQILQHLQNNISTNNNTFEPNTHFIQMLQQFKQQQQVKTHIQQRIALQMGAIKLQNHPSSNEVDTSILGIHQFLVNFFKFYLYYYKDQFLRFINMPYGYQPEKRLKFMQGYEDSSDQLQEDQDGIIYGLQYVISDDVFDQFINQFYGSAMQCATKQQNFMIECSKIHDKALFQCFNQALNNFRPYYLIKGPPYLWNVSQKALTFYFIAQDNVQQVFQKTQYRVLKWASTLTGLIIQKYEKSSDIILDEKIEKKQQISLEQIMNCLERKYHPIVLQTNQERLKKNEKIQFSDTITQWHNFEEQKTSVMYEISSLILQELSVEMMNELWQR